MAATVEELNIKPIAGTFGALLLLTGTASSNDTAYIDIVPGHNDVNTPGSQNLRKILAYGANKVNYNPQLSSLSYNGIIGSGNTNSENVDTAVEPTSAEGRVPYSAVSGGAWLPATADNNIPIPRNVCIVIKNDTAGNLNLFEGVMTFTVFGSSLQSFETITETITFTSTAGNKSVGHAPDYRVKYGQKMFWKIFTVTLDNVPANGLKISVGVGSKIYLPMSDPVEASFIQATQNGTQINFAGAGLIDFDNSSFNFGTIADGDDISMTYVSNVTDAYTTELYYSAPFDGNFITISGVTNADYTWWILGEDAGG